VLVSSNTTLRKHKGKEEGCVGKNTIISESTCVGSQSKSVLFCKPSWRLRTLPLPCYFCIHLVSGVYKTTDSLPQILVATRYVQTMHFKSHFISQFWANADEFLLCNKNYRIIVIMYSFYSSLYITSRKYKQATNSSQIQASNTNLCEKYIYNHSLSYIWHPVLLLL